jgi:hypothetical protein
MLTAPVPDAIVLSNSMSRFGCTGFFSVDSRIASSARRFFTEPPYGNTEMST